MIESYPESLYRFLTRCNCFASKVAGRGFSYRYKACHKTDGTLVVVRCGGSPAAVLQESIRLKLEYSSVHLRLYIAYTCCKPNVRPIDNVYYDSIESLVD
jgi:hypothetical protein